MLHTIRYCITEHCWKFQEYPYGKDMYFFDIFINKVRICMEFVADNLEKVHKRTHLNGFLEIKVIQ